eukprot:4303996-Pyramimonas_sp.AAC.1
MSCSGTNAKRVSPNRSMARQRGDGVQQGHCKACSVKCGIRSQRVASAGASCRRADTARALTEHAVPS